METLGSPIYEVKQDSKWYQDKKKRNEEIDKFFDAFEEKYGVRKGFSFYHADYFGIQEDSEAFEQFKDELLKNPTEKSGFHPFKKRSKYYKEIQTLIKQITEINPFKPHDQLGLNNVVASQWINDRWFFQVRNQQLVDGDEIVPIDYKDYLKIVMDKLEGEE